MIQCAVLFPFSRCENFEARGEGGKGGGACARQQRPCAPARPPARPRSRRGGRARETELAKLQTIRREIISDYKASTRARGGGGGAR